MKLYYPGTLIETDEISAEKARLTFGAVFSAGGLLLSQVSALSGIELYTVQNWVKRGFCSPPSGKKYTARQFCRLLTINMLKDSLTIPEITGLLSSINGQLSDESDDLIADDELYYYFIEVISGISSITEKDIDRAVSDVVSGYFEPYAGVRNRLSEVLRIMSYAYYSSVFRRASSALLEKLR